ncbi:hypothetical protein K432DRAFT_429009 [Lepidopterella palustris CBS 459.81]|uniref:Protein EFR3 n=1 Tax=Lepidopterella palustris CBS 459.81 TaxID=1314670 RepID=A0A8E2JB27_9PEZI|nr:hypothetical protein K432DRAFT_429009 [Lepidopterella palustris CBS 459.81]
MNAARQACRPKHQVLVLKCYPKFQKNNVEVKPNSSELSYLLYYASTRRSKLQKVGDFLDKRTTTDVWKGRIGNVQVTLEILKALIEKCPRDLPLYAGAVLRILRTVLRSNDVTMVEESVPTFETFCAHQDPATLAADQDYIRQYEETVQLYAEFASKEAVSHTKTPISWPVAIRFRKAGLEAIKGVASSESLGSETGRQLAVIIPVILLNIYSESGEYLQQLESREKAKEEVDKENSFRRRQSVSTVRTVETVEGDPIAASGTTEDADKLAEEEVGIVALQALRHIFTEVNRGQLRLATSAVLKFIANRVKPHQHFTSDGDRLSPNDSWPTTLFAMICGWAPVQDRFIILVGTMETLIRSPIVEEDMERQLVLATIIDYLLSSTINFIGLSVMDVLIGLISHTLLLLQLGGNDSAVVPHHQQTEDIGSSNEKDAKSSGNLTGRVVMETVKEPSRFRLQLLATLQKCMGSLATHVYYTDQISDMLSTILSRLKPSPLSGIPTTATAIEDPSAAVDAVASSASIQEKSPYVDNFFSFETARLTALAVVKEILTVANIKSSNGSSSAVGRTQVEVCVWEGTQWLLRDPSGKVRKAYADALLTWLNLELKQTNLRIIEDRHSSKTEKKEKGNEKSGNLTKRAISNVSQREKSPRRFKSTFLALLHLAIYENAHQYVDSEPDILILHLLLTNLIQKLGVNSVRSGLPMIMRLQEDIPTIASPISKIRIGSLVHGYFWALSMAFDFETSSVGRALHSEISRRNDKGLWLKSVQVPPVPLERIELPASYPSSVGLSPEVVQAETLRPFDNREALIENIADGYSTSLYSPPSSPPGSPGRSLSMPLLNASPPPQSQPSNQLPPKIREQLMSDWSKDVCVATTTKDSSSSASISGSKTGTSGKRNTNNLLAVNIPNGGFDNGTTASPRPTNKDHYHSRPSSAAYGLVGGMHNGFPSPRRGSPSATPLSSSSVRSTVRVEDLKRVLSGSAPRTAGTTYTHRGERHHHGADNDHDNDADDTGSESMVSADFSVSEMSFALGREREAREGGLGDGGEGTSPPANVPASGDGSAGRGTTGPTPTKPLQSHPLIPSTTTIKDMDPDAVPPVPPLPAALKAGSVSPERLRAAPVSENGNGNGNAASLRQSRNLKRQSERERVASRSRELRDAREREVEKLKAARPDFRGLLDTIGVNDDDETGGNGAGVRPPY